VLVCGGFQFLAQSEKGPRGEGEERRTSLGKESGRERIIFERGRIGGGGKRGPLRREDTLKGGLSREEEGCAGDRREKREAAGFLGPQEFKEYDGSEDLAGE